MEYSKNNDHQHRIATIHYPHIPNPIPLAKIFVLLLKARESFAQISFTLKPLIQPKAGECFLELLYQQSQTYIDGYTWEKHPIGIEKIPSSSISASLPTSVILLACGSF